MKVRGELFEWNSKYGMWVNKGFISGDLTSKGGLWYISFGEDSNLNFASEFLSDLTYNDCGRKVERIRTMEVV